jgi:predicted RNase H-like HicB family nuclease
MQTYELTIVIERDEDGRYLAVCPALQGCYTEGDSEEEARTLIMDAIRLHIESRLEHGEPLPAEVSTERISVSV